MCTNLFKINSNEKQLCQSYQVRWTWCGKLLYRYGKAILYSVLMGWRIMILLMSLNSFQSSSLREKHKKSGYTQNKSSEWIVDATKLCFYLVMTSQLWKIRSLIKGFAELHLKVMHRFVASFLELFSWPVFFIPVGALTGDSCPSQGVQTLVLQGWPC